MDYEYRIVHFIREKYGEDFFESLTKTMMTALIVRNIKAGKNLTDEPEYSI